ncbi:hypothetical protein IG631_07308 [Alternaria alternata]|nr:hypothetical protein IG631_07308 [Alternaria alternata]
MPEILSSKLKRYASSSASSLPTNPSQTALCGRYLESPSVLPTSLTEHIK